MAGDERQFPGPISTSINSILAARLTPENANEDDGSSVTGSSTGLKSPIRGRTLRSSFASPTQSSNARRGIVSPLASGSKSPLTSPLTSPVTSSRPSSIPRLHRKNHSVDSTPRVTRSPSPLNDITRPTASLSERLKSPEQRRTQGLQTKTSQHRRARSHDQNYNLKSNNRPDKRGAEREAGASHGSTTPPVERHDSPQVREDIASEARDQAHNNELHDVEVTKEPTRSEKLEALPRLVLPEDESSNYSTVQTNTISPIKEEEPEEPNETQKSPSVDKDEVESKLLQDEIQDLNNQLINDLENENETLHHSLHTKDKYIEARNKLIEALNESLRIRSEELQAATSNMRTSDETLAKLRNDFTELTNAAKHVLRRNVDTKLDPKILQNLSENAILSPEAKELYTNFVQIVQKLEFRLRTLAAQSHKHHEDSNTRKERLEIVEKEFPEIQEREKRAVLEGRKAKQDVAIWKQRYEDERKLRGKAQHDYRSFKKTAEEMYQPDLEKKNKELQSDFLVVQYDNTQLQQRVEQYKASVSNWEDEHSIMKERAEKERSELESEIERQKSEMVVYIKKYHDKLESTSHWNFEGLHERINELEREHSATMDLLKTIKQEKATLEETTIPGYLAHIVSMQEEHRTFKDKWAQQRHALTTSPALQLTAGIPNPRFLHPQETAKREAKMEELRQHQCKRREDREKTDAYNESVLEKAQKRIIRPEVYEKGEWREFKGKSNWQIWERDSWVCHASKREFKVVEKLRERGRIPREVQDGSEGGEEETMVFPRIAELFEDEIGKGEVQVVLN